MAKEVRFERDQILFREGDECSEFYLIVTGLVALEIAAPGHTFRVQTLFAGDELGWSALLMGSGKHFQARTLERVDALAFEGAELLAACREDTAIRLHAHAAAAGASSPSGCRRRGSSSSTCTRRSRRGPERSRPASSG